MAIFLSDAFVPKSIVKRPAVVAPEIKTWITKSKRYADDGTLPADAIVLRIFSTVNQKTWLVATPKMLYCILDDLRKPEPIVQWADPLTELVLPDGTPAVEISIRKHTDNTGMVDIGPNHKDWVFSYDLFEVNDIVDSIKKLLTLAVQKRIEPV